LPKILLVLNQDQQQHQLEQQQHQLEQQQIHLDQQQQLDQEQQHQLEQQQQIHQEQLHLLIHQLLQAQLLKKLTNIIVKIILSFHFSKI